MPIFPCDVQQNSQFSVNAKNSTIIGKHLAGIGLGLSLLLSLGFFGLFITNARAETTHQTESFGRLFTTPTERQRLDILRQTQVLKLVNTPAIEAPIEVVPITLPAPITLQGYVKRSDGAKSTVWINNQAVQEGSELNSVQIGNLQQNGTSRSENLNVHIPANGRQVRLKAGQMYTPDTHQIIELKSVAKNPALLVPTDNAKPATNTQNAH